MAEYNVASLSKLIEQFERLPGIGHKSAARLAYHMLSMPEGEAEKFSNSIIEARRNIRRCSVCCNMTDKEICSICSDETRDKSLIFVVEDFRDVMAFEKAETFNASYHVLNGVISPINSVTPDMLTIKQLLSRLDGGTVKEVVMATNATVEGEATAMYISKLIKPLGIKVSRLAYGIPVGGNLIYADEITLARAVRGRSEI